MDIKVNIDDENMSIDKIKFQKMCFIFNALNDGWVVKKQLNKYIFTKKHEGKREVFEEKFLATFMKDNSDINKLLC